jgi:hypothetical protein
MNAGPTFGRWLVCNYSLRPDRPGRNSARSWRGNATPAQLAGRAPQSRARKSRPFCQLGHIGADADLQINSPKKGHSFGQEGYTPASEDETIRNVQQGLNKDERAERSSAPDYKRYK